MDPIESKYLTNVLHPKGNGGGCLSKSQIDYNAGCESIERVMDLLKYYCSPRVLSEVTVVLARLGDALSSKHSRVT
jgi:hypothetical protein